MKKQKNMVIRLKQNHYDFYKKLGNNNIHDGLDKAMKLIHQLEDDKTELIIKDMDRLIDHIKILYGEKFSNNLTINNIPSYILSGLRNNGNCNINILKSIFDSKKEGE